MTGFFRALSELFESDLVKSHGWVLLVSFIICVAISWTVMWFIFVKIIVPSKTIEADNVKRDNGDLTKKLQDAEKEINKLKNEKQ